MLSLPALPLQPKPVVSQVRDPIQGKKRRMDVYIVLFPRLFFML